MSGSLTGIYTHTQRVKRLYKGALKNLFSFYDRRCMYRYQAVLLRQRFEENRCVSDPKVATYLVEQGEEELEKNKHYQTVCYHNSPGGSCYQREVVPPDWVLDYWHPLEKAQYPEYFQRREQRKKEFIAFWEKMYGKSTYKPKFKPPYTDE